MVLAKNSQDTLIIDFDFPNCIAQLSVTNFSYVPYQYVFFDVMDIDKLDSIYSFFDDETTQKQDVLAALDKTLKFCLDYKKDSICADKNVMVKFDEI